MVGPLRLALPMAAGCPAALAVPPTISSGSSEQPPLTAQSATPFLRFLRQVILRGPEEAEELEAEEFLPEETLHSLEIHVRPRSRTLFRTDHEVSLSWPDEPDHR